MKKKIRNLVLLAAISDPDECYNNKKYSKIINLQKAKEIVLLSKKYDLKLIFFSTEFIYDGKKGNYSEKSIAKPINLYGKYKLSVEKFIKKNLKKYCILRIAKTYSDFSNDSTIVNEFLKKLKTRKTFQAAFDQKFNPLYVLDLVNITNYLIKKNIFGIFNVGGPETFSRYSLYKKLNLIASKSLKSYKKPVIEQVSIKKFKFVQKRPADVSFNVSKISKIINFKLTNVDLVAQKVIKSLNKK
jgi:dTDP-4-dehydrorhamnose reductase